MVEILIKKKLSNNIYFGISDLEIDVDFCDKNCASCDINNSLICNSCYDSSFKLINSTC